MEGEASCKGEEEEGKKSRHGEFSLVFLRVLSVCVCVCVTGAV